MEIPFCSFHPVHVRACRYRKRTGRDWFPFPVLLLWMSPGRTSHAQSRHACATVARIDAWIGHRNIGRLHCRGERVRPGWAGFHGRAHDLGFLRLVGVERGFGEIGLSVLFGRRRALSVFDFQVHFCDLVGEVVVLLLAFPWLVQRVPRAFQAGFRIAEFDAEALRGVGVVGDDSVELSDDAVGAVVDVRRAGAGPMLMLAFQSHERAEHVEAVDGHVP